MSIYLQKIIITQIHAYHTIFRLNVNLTYVYLIYAHLVLSIIFTHIMLGTVEQKILIAHKTIYKVILLKKLFIYTYIYTYYPIEIEN